jgi:hypothetical protein
MLKVQKNMHKVPDEVRLRFLSLRALFAAHRAQNKYLMQSKLFYKKKNIFFIGAIKVFEPACVVCRSEQILDAVKIIL